MSTTTPALLLKTPADFGAETPASAQQRADAAQAAALAQAQADVNLQNNKLTPAQIKLGAGWGVLPASGATVGAVIGTNVLGQFNSANIAAFFAANVIVASLIDVEDLFAQRATITNVLSIGTDVTKYNLRLDGTGVGGPLTIINNQLPASENVLFGYDSEDKLFLRGGLAPDTIDNMNVFSASVLAKIFPVVSGSTGGTVQEPAYDLNITTVTHVKEILITSANTSEVDVSVNFSDSDSYYGESNPGAWVAPRYTVVLKRKVNLGSSVVIKTFPEVVGVINFSAEPAGNGQTYYETTLDLSGNLQHTDLSPPSAVGDKLTYTVEIRRTNASGRVNAPRVTGLSISQAIQGGGVAGEASTLNGNSGSYYLDANNFTNISAWALTASKPSYTYSEVGAASSGHHHNASYLGLTAKANDSDKVDGYHGYQLDHRRYTDSNNYLGGYYTSGGLEKPNHAAFSGGKLKLAMLSAANVGGSSGWLDCLWMSGYTGGDVKGSNLITLTKQGAIEMYIHKQNFDSASWGAGVRVLHSSNYTSYSPTKTGSGASGTWGISISGTAANATNATNATNAVNADKLDGYHHTTFGKLGSTQTWGGTQTFNLTNLFDDSQAYRGLKAKGNSTSGYIRAPTSGFLPSSNGVGVIGTSGWRFSSAYINTIYEGTTRLVDKYQAKGSYGVLANGQTWTGTNYFNAQIQADGGIQLGAGKYISFNNANSYYMRESTGPHGTTAVYGRKAGYSGYSIEGRVVLMHNGASSAGLYNDLNSQWMMLCTLGGSTTIQYAGATKLATNSGGATVTGTLTSTGDVSWSSDMRIKQNIRRIPSASKIRQGWTGNLYTKLGVKTAGLLSQEVQKNFPRGVSAEDTDLLDNEGNELDQLLNLNASPILGVLVEAANEDYCELTQRLNQQQAQIGRLVRLVKELINADD